LFGTILKEISGFFDRRALVSAFWPSLVFWVYGLLITLYQELGWRNAIQCWKEYDFWVQGFFVFAFLTWVIFWSFLTLNFRPLILSIYEGNWPDKGILHRIATVLKKKQQKIWRKLDSKDKELEGIRSKIKDEQDEFQKFTDDLSNKSSTGKEKTSNDTEDERLKKEISKLIKAMSEWIDEQRERGIDLIFDLPENNHQKTFFTELTTYNRKLRCLLKKGYSCKYNALSNKNLKEEFPMLVKLALQFESFIKFCLAECQSRRLRLHQQLFLNFPNVENDLVPTRLGNVLKAVELHSFDRYKADAVLIWPRLHPNLPGEFRKTLQNAKVSLDLMITLSSFSIFFGLISATYLAVNLTWAFPLWFPFLVVLIASPMKPRFSFFMALTGLLLSFALCIIPCNNLLIKLQFFFSFLASSAFLFQVCYSGAIHAALAYGEKIKTAFDLYRGEVLKSLNLQMPYTLECEREVWDKVCKFLYRNVDHQMKYDYDLRDHKRHDS